jgi:hypothetical protein
MRTITDPMRLVDGDAIARRLLAPENIQRWRPASIDVGAHEGRDVEVGALRRSIDRDGLISPVVCGPDRTLIDGWRRILAWGDRGVIDVIEVHDLAEATVALKSMCDRERAEQRGLADLIFKCDLLQGLPRPKSIDVSKIPRASHYVTDVGSFVSNAVGIPRSKYYAYCRLRSMAHGTGIPEAARELARQKMAEATAEQWGENRLKRAIGAVKAAADGDTPPTETGGMQRRKPADMKWLPKAVYSIGGLTEALVFTSPISGLPSETREEMIAVLGATAGRIDDLRQKLEEGRP